jgi:hypothetical protein
LVITLSEEESFLGIKIHDEEAHMNISKRILRFGVAALAVAIGSQAIAADPIIAESFEGPASGSLVTNLPTSAWTSTGADLSVITNMDYTNTYTATTLPLTNSVISHTNVAQLATQGGMLSFTNGESLTLIGNALYVDAMVKFVLIEDDPLGSSITNDTKIAIFANSSSNLVIRHGWYDATLVYRAITNSVITSTIISPEAWYRLTIRLKREDVPNPDPFAEPIPLMVAVVQLNGVTLTSVDAYSNTWFFSCLETDTPEYKAVSFTGTGFIDDVVVTRDVPTFATGSGFFYVIEEHTNGVFVAYFTVTAPAGWTNTYAAARSTWYTNKFDTGTAGIFELGADNRTVTAPVPTGSENPTNVLKMLLDQPLTAGELPGQFAGMSPADIAWIRSFGGAPSDTIYTNANSLAFEQAMKLSPYAQETVTAQITSFTVGTSSSTIVVKALTNGVAYASASGLTVNILIDSKASLTNTWPAAAGITNAVTSFNVLGEATNTFNTPIGTFFRARILPQ